MRLDKFISSATYLTRSMAQKALKSGEISVNGNIIKQSDYKITPEKDNVIYKGKPLIYKQFTYILLNKPQGYVSATTDDNQNTVLDLLPQEMKKLNLFPCGRLDKDTVGLVILTNDGVSAHNALSPKKHVTKKYLFETIEAYSDNDIKAIECGITLKDGYTTKPCKIERISENSGYIYLTEGKYHEIKRLFGARTNKITVLKRIEFGKIQLSDLAEGEWRYMTDNEINDFIQV